MKLEGIVTALVTPVGRNFETLRDGLKSLIEFQVKNGISGFFILGTYGEGLLLSKERRKKFVESVIEFTPSNIPVIINVSATDVETAYELALHAKDVGATAVSAVGPIYHKPDKQGLILFYKYIAKVDMPLLVYNNVGRQGYNIDPATFGSIAEAVSNVVGIKDTSYRIDQIRKYVEKFGNKYTIAGAGDSLIALTFVVKAHAHICGISNAFPELAVKIYRLVKEGNVEEALKIQGLIDELRSKIKKFPIESAAVIKEILKLRGINAGYPLIPIRELSDEEKKELKKLMEPYLSELK